MVTSSHEAAHRIFQDRPELLTPVFRILGVPFPEPAAVEVLTPDCTEVRPLERRVDTVLRVKPSAGRDLLLAIEAQRRPDAAKEGSWAYYLSYLMAKHECPAMLLVVCQSPKTADWAAGPFRLGPQGWTSLTVHPLVLGPGNVPVISDAEEAARQLPLAALSAIIHGQDPQVPAILKVLARALGASGKESADYYMEMVEIGLVGDQTRKIWRDLMTKIHFPGAGTLAEEMFLAGEAKGRVEGTVEGRVEGEAKGRVEGRVEGEARGKIEGKIEERARVIPQVLESRGVALPPRIRERITTCTDYYTLQRWLDRSFTATSADDLFAEDDE